MIREIFPSTVFAFDKKLKAQLNEDVKRPSLLAHCSSHKPSGSIGYLVCSLKDASKKNASLNPVEKRKRFLGDLHKTLTTRVLFFLILEIRILINRVHLFAKI